MDISQIEEGYEPLQAVKRRFFALRNGVIADTLRKAGSPFRVIFGLNLPQLREIAAVFGKDEDLARKLWQNSTTRESLLLAPMLMPVGVLSKEEAAQWLASCPSTEVADLLCHSLLRHESYACTLTDYEAAADSSDMAEYGTLRLTLNLLQSRKLAPERAMKIASAHASRLPVLAAQIKDEAEFLSEN